MDGGFAYRCYCSEERLDAVRKARSKQENASGYDRHCRNLTQDERDRLEGELNERGESPVVRFKMPLEGTTTIDDMVRGEVTFENRLVDDFVMLKSDGYPTYHLAHLVDDHEMKITHVLRGEEWLPSVPRHLQLYKALGLGASAVRAPANHSRARPLQAQQAARRDFPARISRDGLPAAHDGELPDAAWLVA